MPESPRPAFNSYALPLPRRREGPAAALSFLAHLTIAILVLWRGAALFEGGGGGPGPRGGGGGGGRPAVSWFALPAISSAQAHDIPQPPAVTVPTVAVPATEPVKIEIPPPSVAVTPPAAVGTGAGTTGGPGQGPGTGGGKGTGTGTGVGADSGTGSGGNAGDIVPANVRGLIIPPDCARGNFLVRFWVESDGRVSQVDVTPRPRDASCHQELLKHMKQYSFRPAMTRAGLPVASVYQIRLVH
jgi:protein TonB